MDFDWEKFGISCCFAGSKDELVVAGASQNLHIWSVPPGRFNSSTAGGAVVEQLMRIPSKFADQGAGLCFSKERSALISSGFGDDQIKVFIPYKLPQQPISCLIGYMLINAVHNEYTQIHHNYIIKISCFRF